MLAIAGGKGGTGKSTSALGLAGASDDPTLVVDLDVDMPDLHHLAGVDRAPTLAAVADRPPTTVAHPRPGDDGVSVLPAPRPEEDVRLDAVLDRLRRERTWTLVDCPGGTGPDVARPLGAAAGTLIVSTPCAPALRDAARTAAMARALGTPVVGAVLTRTRATPSAVTDLLGCEVLGAVPETDPPVLASDAVREAFDRITDQLAP